MITDKVLIVADYKIKYNQGGPQGYYTKCIHENIPSNVEVINSIQTREISLIKKIKLRTNYIKNNISQRKIHNQNLVNKFIKTPKYKYLYFHEIFSLYDVINLISDDQIVILQSHSPELPSQEEYNKGANLRNYKIIKSIEEKSFKRANVLVLPNKNCVDIYKTLITKKHDIKYLITGIKLVENINPLPIDISKINLFYIGRRIEIKGFHKMLKVFNEVSKERDDLRLYIAGKGNRILGKNIIDIGTTEIALSWIKSMDFVLAPNLASYFDLNVIEAISMGSPLIMTTTEGHEFFNERKGIISVKMNNFKETLLDKTLVNKEYKKENNSQLLEFYNKELSASRYQENLKNLSNEIITEY